jgi:hypothetical protein
MISFKKQRCVQLSAIFLAGLTASCTPRARDIVKVKVFALNPSAYLEKKVSIEGTVSGLAPAGAGFLLTDDSGAVFVSTEKMSDKFLCPEKSTMFLEGFLHERSSIAQTYFMMTHEWKCETPSSRESSK